MGSTVTVNTEYTVTQADIDSGEGIINTAVVAGETARPQNPEEPIPTELADPGMSISKSIVDAKEQYRIGDTIQYRIEAANDGNTALNNVVITDQLIHASGEVVFEESGSYSVLGNTARVHRLDVDETVIINCSYTVAREDAGQHIANAAVAVSD